ncbi:hypothetical protein HanRHA438_Chr11g0488401 [Helianthus annuus]|nr:hypothetical protein HanRHA438_Chr11g0488401 [Helianthus annuus]
MGRVSQADGRSHPSNWEELANLYARRVYHLFGWEDSAVDASALSDMCQLLIHGLFKVTNELLP